MEKKNLESVNSVNTVNTVTDEKTPTALMVGKSAPVGKTLAIHRFTVYEVKSVKELPILVDRVLVVTNMGDKGKDNRDTAEKMVTKKYKDRKYTIEYESTACVRYEMSLETFLTYADPAKGMVSEN